VKLFDTRTIINDYAPYLPLIYGCSRLVYNVNVLQHVSSTASTWHNIIACKSNEFFYHLRGEKHETGKRKVIIFHSKWLSFGSG